MELDFGTTGGRLTRLVGFVLAVGCGGGGNDGGYALGVGHYDTTFQDENLQWHAAEITLAADGTGSYKERLTARANCPVGELSFHWVQSDRLVLSQVEGRWFYGMDPEGTLSLCPISRLPRAPLPDLAPALKQPDRCNFSSRCIADRDCVGWLYWDRGVSCH